MLAVVGVVAAVMAGAARAWREVRDVSQRCWA